MGIESLTDEKIRNLLLLEKRITNPNVRNKAKGKHTERDYTVIDKSGELNFSIFVRQNSMLENDFSAGLIWHMPSGESITLCRYNGSTHSHANRLEGTRLGYECHIHKATERYIQANKKAESFAEGTDRYQTVEGALHCLLLDCNVLGLQTTPDEPRLI